MCAARGEGVDPGSGAGVTFVLRKDYEVDPGSSPG